MQTLSDAASKQAEDSVTVVEDTAITSMVSALSTHVQNGSIATSAAQALSTLAMNESNADAIAKVCVPLLAPFGPCTANPHTTAAIYYRPAV